jgi:quercetin dioxygenase-like cupin family protein
MTKGVKDPSTLYEVERRAYHAARPGFRIAELQISPTQKVPWHYHNNVHDTFYVLEGTIRIFLQQPKEEVRLSRGQTFSVPPKRPHLVTNAGDTSAVFLVLQGIGEYDFVPLKSRRGAAVEFKFETIESGVRTFESMLRAAHKKIHVQSNIVHHCCSPSLRGHIRMASCVPGELIPCAFLWHDPGITPSPDWLKSNNPACEAMKARSGGGLGR